MSLSRAFLASFVALSVMSAPFASHEVPISEAQMKYLGINLAPVEPATWVATDRLAAQVTIPPRQERVVSTPAEGLVIELRAGVGDEVTQGDVLALIESPSLVALQREFLQAITKQKLAAAEFKRDAQLFQEGIIAERRYLATRSGFQEAEATLDERRQALALSNMNEAAIDQLARTRRLTSELEVKAPIDGVILEGMVVVGQRLDRSAPLYRLAQLETLWLHIRVPLGRLAGVVLEAPVELPCKDRGSAQVTLIGRNVDPDSQTVLVRAEAHDVGACLRPGQFLQVRLKLSGNERRFRIPASAVVRTREMSLVFVRAPFGFFATPVDIAGQDNGFAIVTGELEADASVAVSGLAAIKGAWMGLGGSE
nr:efflux RND transporter periplasmic adaptor subunit [Gammaproteobacteria bacterium]